MSKEVKVHCINKYEVEFTICGRVEYAVFSVGGWVFDKIKKEHKCKRCERKPELQ